LTHGQWFAAESPRRKIGLDSIATAFKNEIDICRRPEKIPRGLNVFSNSSGVIGFSNVTGMLTQLWANIPPCVQGVGIQIFGRSGAVVCRPTVRDVQNHHIASVESSSRLVVGNGD
jgi:hypothetical protein